MTSYREDLAYINDAGFSDFSAGAIPGVLAHLRKAGVHSGLVVDLGCGGGRLAEALTGAGYDVLGVDLSPDMIRLARSRAPRARFVSDSWIGVDLPVCAGVTAIGEIVNYRFDGRHSRQAISRLFRRVYQSLEPGGLFLFDVAGPERIPPDVPVNYWEEGPDWSLHVEVDGNAAARWMTRRIVSFRKDDTGTYRRAEELHRLRLFDPAAVGEELERVGFAVRTYAGYGRFRLYPGMHAIAARKPAAR